MRIEKSGKKFEVDNIWTFFFKFSQVEKDLTLTANCCLAVSTGRPWRDKIAFYRRQKSWSGADWRLAEVESSAENKWMPRLLVSWIWTGPFAWSNNWNKSSPPSCFLACYSRQRVLWAHFTRLERGVTCSRFIFAIFLFVFSWRSHAE